MIRPRLGFLGVGWIGRHRMEAMIAADLAEVAVICDPSPEMAAKAMALAPQARCMASLDEMLDLDLDAVVIATPSGAHAAQAIRALEAGAAVFCQKPLARDGAETRAVIAAARRANRLLAVDLSYRFTEGMTRIAELIRSGALGRIFAVDLLFYNAYGPDQPWFYERRQSGGGCVIDLGIHLIDLALWALDEPPEMNGISASLFAGGEPWSGAEAGVEDYAIASFALECGTAVRLACSWRLNAGQDAEIGAAFYGTAGGAVLRNLGGSFYDFIAERLSGRSRETIAAPPDDWGGRAAVDWLARLGAGAGYDAGVERLICVADVIDSIYRTAGSAGLERRVAGSPALRADSLPQTEQNQAERQG